MVCFTCKSILSVVGICTFRLKSFISSVSDSEVFFFFHFFFNFLTFCRYYLCFSAKCSIQWLVMHKDMLKRQKSKLIVNEAAEQVEWVLFHSQKLQWRRRGHTSQRYPWHLVNGPEILQSRFRVVERALDLIIMNCDQGTIDIHKADLSFLIYKMEMIPILEGWVEK